MPHTHRSEIDGLRAFAVVPVVLYHAGLPGFEAGYLGVDIFFVLSGYLITSIILRDVAAGQFSLLQFYERRARRIVPALMAMLAVSFAVGLMILTPHEMADLSKSIVAVATFSSNILFWMQSGYFAPEAALNPLLHTWSLAVEEQFYLLFPPFVVLVWRFWRRGLGTILLALALGSFALWVALAPVAPSFNFYSIVTRAWQLLAGAICAWVLFQTAGPPLTDTRLARLGALSGLGAVVLGMGFVPATEYGAALWTLLPVGGTVLIILLARANVGVGRILCWPPFVWVGLISYSVYLCHQPPMTFVRITWQSPPSLTVMMTLALLSLPLGWLSWRFVEQPFRGSAPLLLPGRKAMLSGATLALLGTGVLGFWGHNPDIWLGRYPQIAAVYDQTQPENRALPCNFMEHVDVAQAQRCLAGDGSRTVVLLGDSHARRMRHAFHDAAVAQGWNPVMFHHTGCYPVGAARRLPLQDTKNRSCADFLDSVTPLVLSGDWPVVVMARWTLYLDGQRFDNGEGGREPGAAIRMLAGDKQLASPHDLRMLTVDAFQDMAARGPVLALSQFPEAGWNVPRKVSRLMMQTDAEASLSTGFDRFRDRNVLTSKLFGDLSAAGVMTLDLSTMFCDSILPGRCVNYHADKLYYTDDDHPSAYAAEMISNAALGTLDDLKPRR